MRPKRISLRKGKDHDRRYGRILLWLFLICLFPLLYYGAFRAGYILLGINVTRLQYNMALSQWRSQNITEYDATVTAYGFAIGGDYQLHVRNGQLVEAHRMTEAGPVLMAHKSDFEGWVNEMTIEGLFHSVDDLTAGNPIDLQYGCAVDFDPVVGYPSRIECHPKPWNDITDSDRTTLITSLKVLQRATPTRTP